MAALILCLILAASLLQACALAPVVMVASTTTAALVMEAEKAVTKGDTSDVLAVEQEVVVYEGPGEQYSEITRLNKGVEVKVLGKDGDWIECKSGRFEEGWIHISAVKDI
jgi:N-acetylmuramoyl-L-alanine amidase